MDIQTGQINKQTTEARRKGNSLLSSQCSAGDTTGERRVFSAGLRRGPQHLKQRF